MISGSALVTGAGGFIGYHLTSALKKCGLKVYALLLPGECCPFADTVIVADIRDYASMQGKMPISINYVFHLAAIASVPESVKNPRADFETNLLGTFNMLEISRGFQGLKAFVFPSSVSSLERDVTAGYSERNGYGPSTPYGASKMAGEGYCIAYHTSYGMSIKIVRMFNVYGPRKQALVVYDFIKKLANKPNTLKILGDGNQVRDFLFVEDVCDGLLLIAAKGKDGDVYHLASGNAVTIRELIDGICSILEIENIAITSEADTWTGDMQKWFADISKVKELGFFPKTSLREGLEKTIRWYKEKQ